MGIAMIPANWRDRDGGGILQNPIRKRILNFGQSLSFERRKRPKRNEKFYRGIGVSELRSYGGLNWVEEPRGLCLHSHVSGKRFDASMLKRE